MAYNTRCHKKGSSKFLLYEEISTSYIIKILEVPSVDKYGQLEHIDGYAVLTTDLIDQIVCTDKWR